MDIFDQAQKRDAALTAQAIAAALPKPASGPSAEFCGWCNEPIPEARRQAVPGCDLCIRCQEQREHFKEQG